MNLVIALLGRLQLAFLQSMFRVDGDAAHPVLVLVNNVTRIALRSVPDLDCLVV